MATPAQVKYIRDLMVDAGHAHRDGHLRASSKGVPHGPSMRERQEGVEKWATKLTYYQTVAVIAALNPEE